MKDNNLHILVVVAFVLIALDSLMTYIGKQITGTILPVNIIIPFLIAAIFVIKGKNYILPDKKHMIWLSVAALGLTAGTLTIPNTGIGRLFEVAGALVAFITGYMFSRWAKDEDQAAKPLLLIGLLYTAVCVIAVSKLMPQYFPIITKLWAFNGELIERPEVTTDQNFQIFYLIPGIIVFALPFKKIRFILSSLVILGSLYTLAVLQTRSGLLVAIGLIALITLAPIWSRNLGKWKIYLIPAISLVVAVLFLPKILSLASAIIIRFTETDYSTGLGRLHSFLYLFDKIYNPLWWLPQGNEEFKQLTGNIPHANPTAMFLEGGILALVAWIALVISPLIKLSFLFIKSRLDNTSIMLYFGGLGVFITQLTLNVPLMDQIWLWAGVTNGLLARAGTTIPDKAQKTDTNIERVNNYDRYPKLRQRT